MSANPYEDTSLGHLLAMANANAIPFDGAAISGVFLALASALEGPEYIEELKQQLESIVQHDRWEDLVVLARECGFKNVTLDSAQRVARAILVKD